jgi:outer membrane protein TolC
MVTMLLAGCALAAQTGAPTAAQAPAAAPAVRLSLREALQTALKNNLQVEISQQQREGTRSAVTSALGAFDWNLAATLEISRLETASSAPAGLKNAQAIDTFNIATSRDLNAQLSRPFEWGGSLNLQYQPVFSYSRGVYSGSTVASNNGPYSTSNPYNGTFTATYSQNFLQGFGLEVTTAPLVIARKNAAAADYTFQLAMITLVASTEAQYWAVVQAQKNLENGQISLKLAQQQLDENNLRLRVGTMAPLDVISAEAQVATAEKVIITDQAALDNAKDALIIALFPNGERPASLELTDGPDLGHTQVTEEQAVDQALKHRLELKFSQNTRDVNNLQLTVAQDKLKPQLSGYVGYSGGSDTYNSLDSVNSDLAGAKYPGYTVGLSLAMPIQNRVARGNLAAARATLRGSELTLRNQELSITLEVRTAVRNIDATEKEVKAAEKARYLQEKTLEAEQKKFQNGMSTNFNVLQDMTNLDQARATETTAQIDYATAVTALEKALGDLLEARNFSVQ